MVFAEQPPNSSPSLDPEKVHTLPELAAALGALRGTRSYAALIKAAEQLPPRGGRRPALSKATLNSLVSKAESVPERDTVVTFLTVCGVRGPDQDPWLAAWERVKTRHQRRPAGARRVREADPRRLGVHASIQVTAGTDDLPPYVRRDFDAELRNTVDAAARTGGMVLLCGGSSVGKTRALFEAAGAVLPEWWLLHPADAAGVRAFAQAPTPRTVVWLDELQRYLDQPGGLPAGSIRDLLAAGVVVLATLWPDEVANRSAPRVPGEDDRHAEDRELLKLARIMDVPATFSIDERRRAEQRADDGRIRIALEHADPGVTQVLAAGPELIRRWRHAPAGECYGQAVITAALDARRVGAQAPLTIDYLEAAAPAYLTPAQQATAPPDWFGQAIRYAVKPVQGAASCLTPVPVGMGQIAGYLTADYLHQTARTIRRTEAVPDPVWQALVTHHPHDWYRLSDNAERRGQPEHAIGLYRRQAGTGDVFAAAKLNGLLVEQGRVEELRQRADAGDEYAAKWLVEQRQAEKRRQQPEDGIAVELLIEQDQIEEATRLLRQSADAGDMSAALRLSGLLAGQGRLAELRQRADSGDVFAAGRLAALLVEQGRVEELRRRADAGDTFAAARLAGLLAEQGRVEELRRRADAGDTFAAMGLADLLVAQGRVEELRDRVDAGDSSAAGRLADLLVAQGRVEELRQRVDAGEVSAAGPLARWLAEYERVEELRQRADAGDLHAAMKLVDLLAEQNRIDDLEGEMRAGTFKAAARLAQIRRPPWRPEATK
ncbi:hypothetical protein [Actinoplanes subglobosus]|uniref:Uncharacterized protein n=1 Tax=Actinoplanes subglobosus TaxID=1547892 RepID=A0ABV8J5K4_9ACTN